MATMVVFKKFPEGDVIALFPEQKEYYPGTCNSYQHIGQHGACLTYHPDLKRATQEEYSDLLEELVSIGYDDLVIKQRLPRR